MLLFRVGLSKSAACHQETTGRDTGAGPTGLLSEPASQTGESAVFTALVSAWTILLGLTRQTR